MHHLSFTILGAIVTEKWPGQNCQFGQFEEIRLSLIPRQLRADNFVKNHDSKITSLQRTTSSTFTI